MNRSIEVCARRGLACGMVAACVAAASGQVTTIQWAAPVSGAWSNPFNWLPTQVPEESGDLPVLGTVGGPYTVTMDSSYSIAGLMIQNPLATLEVLPQPDLSDTTLTLGTTQYFNNGVLHLISHGSGGGRVILNLRESTTLTGSGELRLDGGAEINLLNATTNNSRILGAGRIKSPGGGRLMNNAEVTANQTGEHLDFTNVSLVQNNGRFRATNGAVLDVYEFQNPDVGPPGGPYTTGPGSIEADNGTVNVGFRLMGGHVKAVNGGRFVMTSPLMRWRELIMEGEFAQAPTTDALATIFIELAITNNGLVRLTADPTTHNHLRMEAGTLTGSPGQPLPGVELKGSGELRLEEADETELYLWGGSVNHLRLSGLGTILGKPAGMLINQGTLAPGLPTGTMKSQLPIVLDHSGTLEIELAGAGAAQHDLLSAPGQPVTLGGTLDVRLADGFTMSPCLPMLVVLGNVSGTFDHVIVPATPQGAISVRYAPIGVTVVYIPADVNGDGLVDFGDYLEFLNLYDAQDPRVDYNQDGLVDFSDYLQFLNLFDSGC